LDCHRVCLETAQHCLHRGGKHADAAHIGLLQSCASICETSVQFMIADSVCHEMICATCAAVCTTCAEDCDEMSGSDAEMRRCAEVCRNCASLCDQMGKSRTAA
jgi:hypothetical protein